MVTGVETAGLVLGSIPLILAGLEFYAKGIAVTKRYLKFRQACKDLCNDLRTEHAMCRNSLQRLLIGVVQDKDMNDFLDDPRCERWREEKFERKLKDRLGPTYDSYIETISRMKDTTDVFIAKLKLDASGKTQFQNEKGIKGHYKRLKFSLQKDTYDELIARLNKANTALDRMTTQTISIENQKSRTKAERQAIPNFNAIQAHATGFYSALSTGWKCPCLADHSVNLRLESRDHSSNDDDGQEYVCNPFRVVFCNSGGHFGGKDVPSLQWTWEEADVHVTRQSQNPPQLVVRSKKKGVQFETKAKKAVKAALRPYPNLQPIEDLCAAIRNLQNPQRDECLSLLATAYAKQKYGVYIYPLKERPSNPASCSISSLRSVLDHPDFTWRERLHLAVILASSVLQLHKTPWLDDHWGVDNIFFVTRADQIAYEYPFVSQHFNQVDGKSQTDSVPPLMSRIIRNQALYALGVSLIELHYGKSIQKLHKPEDGPLSSADPVAAFVTEWKTADRLVDKLYSDVGHYYGDAVRRCIRCDFDRKSNCLGDIAFQKAVYEGVVSLLQDNYNYLFAPEFSMD